MKKILAVLLSVLMLTGIFAVVGAAAYTADPAKNAIVGVHEEYPQTRTVTFTAVGDGLDNVLPEAGDTRYVPVSWEVDKETRGEFADGVYDVRYTQRKFGNYTLTVVFNQETFDADAGEWVDTGETDIKAVDYVIGATELELKEDVFPSKLVYFIFGVLAELVNKIIGLIKT